MQAQQPTPQSTKWRLTIGEWMVLFLNILLTGFSSLIGFIAFYANYPREPLQRQHEYLEGASLWLVALAAFLSSILLLLRQSRLAAWFQWLVALGCALFAGFYFLFERHSNSLQSNILTLGAMLLIAILFVFSGRFLRTVGDDK